MDGPGGPICLPRMFLGGGGGGGVGGGAIFVLQTAVHGRSARVPCGIGVLERLETYTSL